MGRTRGGRATEERIAPPGLSGDSLSPTVCDNLRCVVLACMPLTSIGRYPLGSLGNETLGPAITLRSLCRGCEPITLKIFFYDRKLSPFFSARVWGFVVNN